MSAARRVLRMACASTVQSMRGAMRASLAASKLQSVREIAHTSTLQAKNSCDLIRLRVQSDLKFGCSMRWSNKRRSITELNSDSHSKKPTVKNKGRQHTRTLQSCGLAPSDKSKRFSATSASSSEAHLPSFLRDAGPSPAFAYARLSPSELARRAEFISVSGSRAARSALRSDLRLKRTSGVAAATPQLHAPMNSPESRALLRDRVSINLNAIA